MPFSWDDYPYTNFHELNLDWFIKKFKEIFDEWSELYNTMVSWKEETDTSLNEWKTDAENDISDWETGVLSDLNDWKDTFETLFDTTFSNLTDIKTDAENARDLAQGYATSASGYADAAATSAASISGSANDIAATKSALLKTCKVTQASYSLNVTATGKYYYFNGTRFAESTSKKYLSTYNVNLLKSVIAFELTNNEFEYSIPYFDETGAVTTSSSTGYLGTVPYKAGLQLIPKEAKRFLLTFKRLDGEPISEEDRSTIMQSLRAYYSVDTTLTFENIPADALTVGEFRQSFDRELTTMYEETLNPTWYEGLINASTGGNVNYSSGETVIRIRSDYMDIRNGMKITVPEGTMARVAIYSSVGGSAGFKKWLDSGWWTGEKIFNNPTPFDATRWRMMIRYQDDTVITTDAGNTITIKQYSFKVPFIEIPQNADLNDYSTPGYYYSLNTATTETLSNCPIPDTAFRLDVIDAKYRGYGSVRQILVKAERESDGFYMRYKTTGTTWGPWDHYLPSKAIFTPYIIYPNVKVHDQRTNANVIAKYRIGTFNVAHYRKSQGVHRDYISEHDEYINKWRNWVMNSDLDFLFITEDSVYIDENATKLATDYLYNPYFYKNDTVLHSHRILTKTEFDTTSLTDIGVSNVNTTPGAISAYYIDWCIIGDSDDPKILLAVIHNFASMDTVGTEAQIKQNRANYCAAIKTLLTNQANNYDYVIIAGDTNIGNYVNKSTSNTEYDMGLFESLCEDCNLHMVNGDEIGWFKTDGSDSGDNDVYDNIIVSNNIRIEKIECNPFECEVLWSDHMPVIAEISLLS